MDKEIELTQEYYDRQESRIEQDDWGVRGVHGLGTGDLREAIHHVLNCIDSTKGEFEKGVFNCSKETQQAYEILDLFANYDTQWTIYHP